MNPVLLYPDYIDGEMLLGLSVESRASSLSNLSSAVAVACAYVRFS